MKITFIKPNIGRREHSLYVDHGRMEPLMLAVLAGSASYIAAPAAMRIAVPEANPSLSLAASLGVTFPFNIIVGIPIYYSIAKWMHTLGV